MRRRTVALSQAASRIAAVALAAASILFLSVTKPCAQQTPPAAEPLVIARQGWMFVGGAIDAERPGAPMVGHMYVEYQIVIARWDKIGRHPLRA
jgi:hypothetical protein